MRTQHLSRLVAVLSTGVLCITAPALTTAAITEKEASKCQLLIEKSVSYTHLTLPTMRTV